MNITHFLLAMSTLLQTSATMASQQQFSAMRDQITNAAIAQRPEEIFPLAKQVKLIEALERSDLEKAQELVDHGADLNWKGMRGMTALYWLLGKRKFAAFQWVLDHGADPNTITCCDDRAGGSVHTLSVMGLAAGLEEASYLEALLEHGGDPNRIIYDEVGFTPIFDAVAEGRVEM